MPIGKRFLEKELVSVLRKLAPKNSAHMTMRFKELVSIAETKTKKNPALMEQVLNVPLWANRLKQTIHHHAKLLSLMPSRNEWTYKLLSTLRMQLQPVFHCSSLSTLDPGSGR